MSTELSSPSTYDNYELLGDRAEHLVGYHRAHGDHPVLRRCAGGRDHPQLYLTRETIGATLAVIGGFAPGTEIVLEYMLDPELRDAAGPAYAEAVARPPPNAVNPG